MAFRLRLLESRLWCLLLSLILFVAAALHDARGETLDIDQADNQLIRRFANALLRPEDGTLPPELGTAGSEEALVATVRMGVFAAELLKKLRSGEPLERYEPYTWGAIPNQLCTAAKLPEGRCVSLACLRAQSDDPNVSAKECNLAASAMAAPAVPPQPSAAAEWRNWLTTIPRESLPTDITKALSRGELPVNQTVLAAKGLLHAIWPSLARKATEFPDLAAAELPALVAGVMADEARRSAEAAQIVAVATLADELPAPTRLLLAPQEPRSEEAFSDLTAAAAALDVLYQDPANLFRLPDDADELLTKGAAAVETLRAGMRGIIPKLPQVAVKDAVEYVAAEICPPLADSRLYPIAMREIALPDKSQGAQFEFALREIDRLADGEITAELVAAVSLPLAEQFDGDGNPIDKGDWKCLGELRQVFPLGITIRRLRERDGRIVLVARDDELVQRAEATLFRSGIVGLANRLALPVTWPTAVEVGGIVLEFSSDFRDVTLKATVSVPVLDHQHRAVVSLVTGGQMQDDPDVAKLLDLNGLLASLNRKIENGTAGRQVAVGPLSATIVNVELATRDAAANPDDPIKTRLAADKRWFSARARLNAGSMAIENASITLIERDGQVLFVPEVDLTPLFRAALDDVLTALAEQGASLGDAMRVHLQRAGEAARPFVDAVTRALMIQRVELNGSGHVAITLGLDIGMIAGREPLLVEHSGQLDFERDDLGLPALYAALAEKAVQNGTVWINEAVRRIDAAVGDLVDAEVQNALQALVAKAEGVGITLEFQRRDDALYDVDVQLAGITTQIKKVRLVAVPPDLDFRTATVTPDAEAKLTDSLITEFNRKIPLNWAKCGSSRISKGAAGFVIELGVESDLVGCLPLPAMVFDGKRLSLDVERSQAAILAALQRRLGELLPEDIAEYVGDARFSKDFRTLLVPFATEIPGLGGIKLSGTATIDLTDGSFKVEVDDKEALFAQAFQFVAGNIGGNDWKVEPLPDQIGVIASGRIDFGVFGVAVEGLQVTTREIRIPELSVRLPAAIPLGPFTVFPTEVRARVQRPYSVVLIGDVGLFGGSSIAMLRGSMRFDDIPPKQLTAGGTIILLTSMELFRTESSLRFSPFVIEGKSETVGLLKAVMPFSQTMRIDSKEATLAAKATILGIHIDGSGRLVLSGNPSLMLAGYVDAGSLAEFSAGLQTDIYLTNPAAEVDGRVGFILGDIEFGADANLRRAKLNAKVIGIRASVTVPTLTHIDAGMIEALFAFLLKPSMDLSNLRELNVQVSPRIAGGGDGNGSDGEGGGNGGLDEGGEQNPDTPRVEGGPPITDPGGAIRTGTIPSEWQSGWLSGADGPETVCYARWKGPDKTDPSQFQWLGSRKVPRPVAELLSRKPPVQVVDLGSRQIETLFYRNCSTPYGTTASTSVQLLLSDMPPVIWAYGSTSYTAAPWVTAIIDKVDGTGRKSNAGISWTARDILAFMFEHGIDSVDDVRRIDLTTGRHFWLIALPEGAIMIRDPDLGMQVHPRSGPIGRWLSAMLTEPPGGVIAERLLPALFIGRSAPVAVYPSEPPDTPDAQSGAPPAILLGHITSDEPIIVPLSRGEKEGCGKGIRVRGLNNWRAAGYSKNYALILAALIESSPGCDYWGELEIVGPPGGEPDRLILVHEGSDDWRIVFTDRLQALACLRIGLDFDRLQTALGQWRDTGALSQTEFDRLLTSGFSFVRRALSTAAPDWRGAGFPFNPLILGRCQEGQ